MEVNQETGAGEAVTKPHGAAGKAKTEKREAGVKSKKPHRKGTQVINMLKDDDGNVFGADNNPKRPGTESHKRFSKYVDGMTIAEARKAGIIPTDFSWDEKHGYISIT